MVTPEISIKDHPQHSSVQPKTATSIYNHCNRGHHSYSGCPWWHFLPSDREDWLFKVTPIIQNQFLRDQYPLQVYTDISETGDVRRPIQAVDVRQPNLSSSRSSQLSWNFINLCIFLNWLLLMWYTNLFFEFTRNKCP